MEGRFSGCQVCASAAARELRLRLSGEEKHGCRKVKAQVDPVGETFSEGMFGDKVNGSGDSERRRTCQDHFHRLVILTSVEHFG